MEVRTGAAAQDIDDTGLVVAGKRIASQTILWAAGVRASPPAGGCPRRPTILGASTSIPICRFRDGRTFTSLVTLLAWWHWRAIWLGASCRTPSSSLAWHNRQCRRAGMWRRTFTRRVRGAPRLKAFRYWDKGNLAIVGRTYAIADLKGLRFAGFLGWLLWIGVHIYYLIGFGNRVVVLAQWAGAILLNRRYVRIFPPADPSGQSRPGAQTSLPAKLACDLTIRSRKSRGKADCYCPRHAGGFVAVGLARGPGGLEGPRPGGFPTLLQSWCRTIGVIIEWWRGWNGVRLPKHAVRHPASLVGAELLAGEEEDIDRAVAVGGGDGHAFPRVVGGDAHRAPFGFGVADHQAVRGALDQGAEPLERAGNVVVLRRRERERDGDAVIGDRVVVVLEGAEDDADDVVRGETRVGHRVMAHYAGPCAATSTGDILSAQAGVAARQHASSTPPAHEA